MRSWTLDPVLMPLEITPQTVVEGNHDLYIMVLNRQSLYNRSLRWPTMFFALSLQTLLFYGLLAFAQSPFQPGYTPLAVKTPYLHGWIASDGDNPSPARVWPNFLTTDRVSQIDFSSNCICVSVISNCRYWDGTE